MSYSLLHSTFGRSLEDGFPDPVLESNLNLDASLVDHGNLENQLYDDVERFDNEQALDRVPGENLNVRVDDSTRNENDDRRIDTEEHVNEKPVEEMDTLAGDIETANGMDRKGIDATDKSLNNSNIVGEDTDSLQIDRNENRNTVDDGLEDDMHIVDQNKEGNVEHSDPGIVPPKKKKKDSVTDEQIRLNRNASKQFNTFKSKVETFQEAFGANQNFILLMENNFVQKVGKTGPTPTTTGKTLVVGSGKLMDMFKADELLYDIETMEVLKTGAKGFATKSKRRPSPVTAAPYLGNQNVFQQQLFQHQQQMLQQQQQQQQLIQQHQQMYQYPPTPFFPHQGIVNSSPLISSQPLMVSPIMSTQNVRPTSTITQSSVEVVTETRNGKKAHKKPKRSEVFTTSDEDSLEEEDLVNDGTDYSEEDQEFIKMIERKNLQRKKKVVENATIEALPSDSSESERDLEESDHGCEVRGAGADKTKKPKKKAALKAAGKRKNQKKTNDILPEELSKTLKSKPVARTKKPNAPKSAQKADKNVTKASKPAKNAQAPSKSKTIKVVPASSKPAKSTPGPSRAVPTVSSPSTLTVKTTRKSSRIMSEESCNRFLDPTPSPKNPLPKTNNRRKIISVESVNRILF